MVRWGIAGAGGIAEVFAKAVTGMKDKEIVLEGIASRNYGKAYKFAKKNGVKKAYESFEAMITSDDIDAVSGNACYQHYRCYLFMAFTFSKSYRPNAF